MNHDIPLNTSYGIGTLPLNCLRSFQNWRTVIVISHRARTLSTFLNTLRDKGVLVSYSGRGSRSSNTALKYIIELFVPVMSVDISRFLASVPHIDACHLIGLSRITTLLPLATISFKYIPHCFNNSAKHLFTISLTCFGQSDRHAGAGLYEMLKGAV